MHIYNWVFNKSNTWINFNLQTSTIYAVFLKNKNIIRIERKIIVYQKVIFISI